MRISEIFYSVQAEGLNLGLPSVFVRLQGCNRRCPWCDTPYALKELGGTNMSTSKVAQKITSFKCKNVVITGGEPLLQQDLIIMMIHSIKGIDPSYTFEIETNGTINPEEELVRLVDLFTVSPKFDDFEFAPKFSRLDNVVFKFVVDEPDDLILIDKFIDTWVQERYPVYLMPQGKTRKEILDRLPSLIEAAKQRNVMVTPRLQILVWGNKRGT